MTNFILILGIVLALAFAIYDQLIMPKWKGKSRLSVELQRQATIDIWISIGLIVLTIAQSVQSGIAPFTLFLLAMMMILFAYLAFFRSPRLLLKTEGFFFGNVFFDYQKIKQIHLAEKQILVIDLHSGRRLLARIKSENEVENVVNFFGGYQ